MSDTTPGPSTGSSFLDKKVSGIKAQYLIIFGLAVAIAAYFWRKHKALTNPVVPVMVDTSGASGGPAPTSSSDGGNGGIGSATPPVPQTNAQWARGALNAAIGNGSVDATDGANAVSAWLNNQQLTAAQAAIIAKLTTAYGQPPEGVLPIIPASSPQTHSLVSYVSRAGSGDLAALYSDNSILPLSIQEWTKLSSPAYTKIPDQQFDSYARPSAFPYTTGHLYTVAPGDTTASLARKFYGLESAAYLIPTPLTPGQVITIV